MLALRIEEKPIQGFKCHTLEKNESEQTVLHAKCRQSTTIRQYHNRLFDKTYIELETSYTQCPHLSEYEEDFGRLLDCQPLEMRLSSSKGQQ